MQNFAEKIWQMYYTEPRISFLQQIWEPYIVPRRTHRKRRIQKKWLKRYGTITRYKMYSIPLHSPGELTEDTHHIIAEYRNYPVRERHLFAEMPKMSKMLNYHELPPTAPAPKVTTYELMPIACNLETAISYYRQMLKHKEMFDELVKRFEYQAFEFFKENLKVKI